MARRLAELLHQPVTPNSRIVAPQPWPHASTAAAHHLRIAAITGSSAGAINGALTVSGLVQGGPELARRKLADFWQALSRRGFFAGNAFLYGEPGSFGINIDWSPIAIAMEAIGLVVSHTRIHSTPGHLRL